MYDWFRENKFKILVILFVIIIIYLIYQYLQITKSVPKVKVKKENQIIVNLLKAKVIDYQPFLSAYGRVKTQRTGNISFGVSGTISYLSEKFVNGGKVNKGEILGKLDQEKYILSVDKLKTDVKELKRQVTLRKKQLDRNKKMLEKNVISPSVYDEELIKYSQNLQHLNSAKINLGLAEKDLKDTILIAKNNGIISDVNIHRGLLVSNNSQLAMFRSLDHVEVEFLVPAKIFSISKKLIGKNIDVMWTSGNERLIQKNGIIVRAQGIINDESGGGKIYAKLIDSLNDSIPLDSFVSVRYPLEKFSSIIKIPETALFDKKYVFVIENGRARKIEVNVVLSNSSYYLLKKDNLEGLDIVVNRFSSDIEGRKIKSFWTSSRE